VSDLAQLDFNERVATLTINRPEARNALSIDLLEAMHDRLEELRTHEEATVCVITGAGKSFCAGMDLKAVLDEPGAPARLLQSIAELTLKIRNLPMVAVARVNGAAIGGGCGLMCVCDLAITHPDAKVGFPEVDLGVSPAVVAPWLALRVGQGRARSILLRGGTMSGEQAHAQGMVTELIDRDGLDARVDEIAGRLAAAGPSALRVTKNWLNELQPPDLADKVRRGAVISADVVSTDEARDRLKAAFAGR